MNIDEITGKIVDACIKIHSTVGPGCFEKVYEEILYFELVKRNLIVDRQVKMPIESETLFIPDAYRIDLLAEQKVIIEIKCVEHVLPVHFKQVMTSWKLMNIKNGILLNFKVDLMKDGIHRVFNNFGGS